MDLNKKIFILSIFIIFISICGVYSAFNYQNNDSILPISNYNNETDEFGCCSIVVQLDGNHTLMSYRRDSNLTADVYIEKVDWHGIPAIKQYKTEGGYFNHVIITNDGWVIGLGGIDDGIDNEICENITAGMINDDYSISESSLAKIQEIKKPYGRGHVIIKAPNGNYGFATVDKLKTGKLEPGRYISLPNDYSLSRGDDFPTNSTDKIKTMNELAQSDKYGVDRREIVTYDIHLGDTVNETDVYVANEDGSQIGKNYLNCIDDVHFNGTVSNGENIPIAPGYKQLGSVTFTNELTNSDKLLLLVVLFAFVVLVGILFFVVLKFVRHLRYKISR